MQHSIARQRLKAKRFISVLLGRVCGRVVPVGGDAQAEFSPVPSDNESMATTKARVRWENWPLVVGRYALWR
jgi:hypothetical protein